MEDEFNVKWSLYKWCSAFLLKADDDGGVPNAVNANAVAWKDLGGGGVFGPGVCVGCFSTCNAEITTASRLWYLYDFISNSINLLHKKIRMQNIIHSVIYRIDKTRKMLHAWLFMVLVKNRKNIVRKERIEDINKAALHWCHIKMIVKHFNVYISSAYSTQEVFLYVLWHFFIILMTSLKPLTFSIEALYDAHLP